MKYASGVFATTAKTTRIRLLYAAHLNEVGSGGCGKESKGAGPVTSRTRGSRSVSYAAPSSSGVATAGDLQSTKYGRRLLGLLAGARHRRGIVG